jgi:hypothetical protein
MAHVIAIVIKPTIFLLMLPPFDDPQMGYIRLTATTPNYPVSSLIKLVAEVDLMSVEHALGKEQRGIDRLGVIRRRECVPPRTSSLTCR